MRKAAETAGLNNAVLVNTCAVTADAVRQARQTIRRVRRDNPARPHRGLGLRRADRA
jgi:threonylcarbamoyladenosine tRNA methylthiotransferase MtaB